MYRRSDRHLLASLLSATSVGPESAVVVTHAYAFAVIADQVLVLAAAERA